MGGKERVKNSKRTTIKGEKTHIQWHMETVVSRNCNNKIRKQDCKYTSDTGRHAKGNDNRGRAM